MTDYEGKAQKKTFTGTWIVFSKRCDLNYYFFDRPALHITPRDEGEKIFTLIKACRTNEYYFRMEGNMDSDLESMSREQLVVEIKKLRQGIRAHRDSTGQELCWHHPALWSLLPEQSDPLPVVPEWPQFLQGCIRYRQSLDEQASEASRTNEPYRG